MIFKNTIKTLINGNQRSRFKDPCNFLNIKLLEGRIPSFYISEHDVKRIKSHLLARGSFDNQDLGLSDHPSRSKYVQKADLHIVSILSKKDLFDCHFLPFRKNKKPYLCFAYINLDEMPHFVDLPFFKREDVIFFSFDLGDFLLKSDRKFILSSVTIPSTQKYEGEQRKISATNNYLISFKGNYNQSGWFDCCCVRKRLKQLSEGDFSGKYKYLYIDTSDDQVSKSKIEYMSILKDSTFCFVLHGDGRWSHRFIEVIGSGAIPIIIADDLSLLFEQVINCDDVCIRIPEQVVNDARDINKILDLLPKDELKIVSMMEKIKVINDTCFKTKLIRMNMLLQSASYHHQINK